MIQSVQSVLYIAGVWSLTVFGWICVALASLSTLRDPIIHAIVEFYYFYTKWLLLKMARSLLCIGSIANAIYMYKTI